MITMMLILLEVSLKTGQGLVMIMIMRMMVGTPRLDLLIFWFAMVAGPERAKTEL